MIYLSFASVCNLLGFKTGLYKRVASNHLITSVFGASVILFWFALDAILTLSDSAFIDSAACKGQTFVNLLHNLCRFLLGYFTDPGSMVIIVLSICLLVPLMFFVAMLHRRASKEAWSYRQGKSKPWVWFYVPWMFMKSYWCVPIITEPQSEKSDTTKVHSQPRLGMVHIPYIYIYRFLLGRRGHRKCSIRVRGGIRVVLWSGMVIRCVVGSQILNIFLTGVVCVFCSPIFYNNSCLRCFSPPGYTPLCST